MNRFLRGLLGSLVLAAISTSSALAAWPDKPITLVVPYPPGGMGTTFGNLVSDYLTPALGQRVVVEFKPGAKVHHFILSLLRTKSPARVKTSVLPG